MGGARNRNSGHQWERDLANYLAEELEEDIVTTRSITGGASGGADISTALERDGLGNVIAALNEVAGWSIEAKNEQGYRIPAWFKQALAQSRISTPFVVMAKRKGKANPGDGFAILPIRVFVEVMKRLRDGTE